MLALLLHNNASMAVFGLSPAHKTRNFMQSTPYQWSDDDSSLLPPRTMGGSRNTVGTQQAARSRKSVLYRNTTKSAASVQLSKKIPKVIPKLSDVMSSATAQDFLGEIDVDPVPRRIDQADRNTPADQIKSRVRDSSKNFKMNRNPGNLPVRTEPTITGEPWKASFAVSKKTQGELKAVEASFSNTKKPLQKAVAVLTTLLKTPPERCNEANVVCALTISAKTMTVDIEITESFRNSLLQTLDVLHELVLDERLNARQLCNAVWAIGKHFNRIDDLLPAPPQRMALSSDSNRGMAESWSLQVDEANPEKRLESTVDMIADQLAKMLTSRTKKPPKVGEICMASWAYGVLRHRRRPPGWDGPPQLGRLPPSEKIFVPRNRDSITFEQWMTGEEVLNSDSAGSLFDAIGEFLCQKQNDAEDMGEVMLANCSWSEIANVAWAYASHGHCRTASAEKIMIAIARETTWRLQLAQGIANPNFLPRDIAQVVWSIGTLQSDNFRLGDDLVALIDAIASRWKVHEKSEFFLNWSNADLVQLAIAMAHARIDHQALINSLYDEALRRVRVLKTPRGFQSWEVSVLLWVQARLYLKQPQGQVFIDFARETPNWILQQVDGANSMEQVGIGPQEQANLAWALTVLEAYDEPASVALLKRIFDKTSSRKNEYMQLEHAHQLWQALYLMKSECPEAVQNVPDWFHDFLKEKWSVEKARPKTSSARHRSLSQCLDLMGVAHYNEHDEDIDVAIVLKDSSAWTHKATKENHENASHKVAVEFDGPNHFTRENTLGKPRALGHTVLKYRLLKKQGWTVVRVPYYEFDKIPFWASMERQRYLQRLLKTHPNMHFSNNDVSEYKVIVPNRITRFD